MSEVIPGPAAAAVAGTPSARSVVVRAAVGVLWRIALLCRAAERWLAGARRAAAPGRGALLRHGGLFSGCGPTAPGPVAAAGAPSGPPRTNARRRFHAPADRQITTSRPRRKSPRKAPRQARADAAPGACDQYRQAPQASLRHRALQAKPATDRSFEQARKARQAISPNLRAPPPEGTVARPASEAQPFDVKSRWFPRTQKQRKKAPVKASRTRILKEGSRSIASSMSTMTPDLRTNPRAGPSRSADLELRRNASIELRPHRAPTIPAPKRSNLKQPQGRRTGRDQMARN